MNFHDLSENIRGSRTVDVRNTAHGDDGKCILSICAFPICPVSAPLVHCSEVIFSELVTEGQVALSWFSCAYYSPQPMPIYHC